MDKAEVARRVRRFALQDAASSLLVNSVTNWLAYRAVAAVPMTVDSITSREPTLFSRSIPGALLLCALLGSITWFKFRKRGRTLTGVDYALLDRPYFFVGLRIVSFYTVFVFGLVVTIGVLLRAWAGTLMVSSFAAVAISTAIAALSAWFITASTMRAQLRAA